MISIREFEIEARINSDPEKSSESAQRISPERLEELKKEIVAESVERVLTIIKNQKER
jgi:hypothetical protein